MMMSIKCLNVCRNLIAPLMAIMIGFVMFLSNPDDARAEGGWALNGSVNYLYHHVYKIDTGGLYGNEKIDIYNYYGGSVDIQPEYRFFDGALGIGVDVMLGGYGCRKDLLDHEYKYQGKVESLEDALVNGEYNQFIMMAFITAKGIIPTQYVDIWGELGLGYGLADFKLRASSIRGRIGVTMNLLDNSLGVGLHAGIGDTGFILVDVSVDAGIHVVKKF